MTIANDLVVMFEVIPWTQVSAVLALFSSYLFSIGYSFLPRDARTKHTFSILASLLLFSSLFGLRDFPQLMISPMLIYGLGLMCRKSKFFPIISFAICIIHLSVHYVFSQLFESSTVSFDSTAPLMVMVIKLTSFAWCLHDGTKDEKVLRFFLTARN
jgi:lysophospholipid acyltransferase